MKNKVKALLIIMAVMLSAVITVYAAYDSSNDPLISKSYLEQVFQAQIDEKINALKSSIEEQGKTIAAQNEMILSQKNLIDRQQTLLDDQAQSVQSLLNTLNEQKKSLEDQLKKIEELTKKITAQQTLIDNQQKSITSQGNTLTEQKTLLDNQAKTIKTMDGIISELSKNQGSAGGSSTYQVVFVTRGMKLICNGGSEVSTEIILRSGSAKAISQYASSGGLAQGLSDATTSTELYDGDSLTINHLIIVPRGDGRGVQVTADDDAYFLVRGSYQIVGN